MAEPVTTKDLTLQNFFSTSLSSSINSTDTVIPLNAVPEGTEGFLVIDLSNSAREIIYYTSKSASSVTCPDAATGRGLGGTSATSHSSGASVKQTVVSQYITEVKNGNALGVGAIKGASIATSAIKLASGTAITTSQTGISSETDITNGTVTVTVPSGGRNVLLHLHATDLQTSANGQRAHLRFKEGGTTVGGVYKYLASTVGGSGSDIFCRVLAPSAGSHTYKVTLERDSGAGTVGIYGDATEPAYLDAYLT